MGPARISFLRLVARSVWFHGRSHLGAWLGAAIATAVLVGALAVGDSVRASLHRLAMLRLGKIELALSSGDRLFRADITGRGPAPFATVPAAQGQLAQVLQVAPALRLPAVAVKGDGTARANQVQVYGVDARFWAFAWEGSAPAEMGADTVLLNEALAQRLGAGEGDEVLLRVRKPTALSAEAPLAPEEESVLAWRVLVRAVVTDERLGRFSLSASQLPPLNAFVSLSQLQTRVKAAGRANLLLAGLPPKPAPSQPAPGIVSLTPQSGPTNLLELAQRGLRSWWQLADAQLEWRELPTAGAVELRSQRVFLDPALGQLLLGNGGNPGAFGPRLQQHLPGVKPTGVLTYFVNALSVGDRSTPYSMVTAASPPLVPEDLKDDEILINSWLAEDLGAKPGDSLKLTYYVVGTARQLEERTAPFRVRAVYPIDTPGVDRELMPDFPGMTDADNCRDWDTGLPIQTGRIRDLDEQYWRQYRGTPKALITLAAGQALWSNRFGDLTAVRFILPDRARDGAGGSVAAPRAVVGPQQVAVAKGVLNSLLQSVLSPASFGLRFEPVRELALAASGQAQNFGPLFLGFSFFLMGAALLLMGLLYQFGIEQRATEVGTFLALGFTRRTVRRLYLAEGFLVAFTGCLLGAWGGLFYAKLMLRGLETIWREAVAGTALRFAVERHTVLVGLGAACVVVLAGMALALRRLARQPARELLAAGAEEARVGDQETVGGGGQGRRRRRWYAVAGLSAAGAFGLWVMALGRNDTEMAGLFFGAGALLLTAGWAFWGGWLARVEAKAGTALTRRAIGLRNMARRRRRSLAVVGLLGSGTFIIAAIGVFRLDAPLETGRRSSGTGGFALIGNSTQPVVHDLNRAAGREVYGLDTNQLAGVAVVPLRVQAGDDASCLNLNRAQRPQLLGVKPEALAERGAFAFASVAKGLPREQGWLLLKERGLGDEVPAIGDQASIVWALGKKVGDALPFTDEQGRPFRVRLVGSVANSILQGSLVIDEARFLERFPSTAGYRMFLVDAPPNAASSVAAALTRALSDFGFEVTPTVERLAAFNAVQNTYLGTFQVLGGFGLLLGSVGLGVVVLRNVLERRGELALLLAIGWRRSQLRRLVLTEHLALLAAGLLVGTVAGWVAVLPAVLRPGVETPYGSLALTLGLIAVNGVVWTWLAAVAAMRGRLLEALRNS